VFTFYSAFLIIFFRATHTARYMYSASYRPIRHTRIDPAVMYGKLRQNSSFLDCLQGLLCRPFLLCNSGFCFYILYRIVSYRIIKRSALYGSLGNLFFFVTFRKGHSTKGRQIYAGLGNFTIFHQYFTTSCENRH